MSVWAWRAAWLIAMSVGLGACAGKQDPAGAGEDCYRDQDCKSGLVCVANAAGSRVCSADVTSLKSTVDGPPADAGTPVDDAGAQGAAGAP